MNCPVWIPSAAMKSSVLFLKRYGSRKATFARGAPRPGSWMISLRKRSEKTIQEQCLRFPGVTLVFSRVLFFFFLPSRSPWCTHGVQRSQYCGVWQHLFCAWRGLWIQTPHLFSVPWSHVPWCPETEQSTSVAGLTCGHTFWFPFG